MVFEKRVFLGGVLTGSLFTFVICWLLLDAPAEAVEPSTIANMSSSGPSSVYVEAAEEELIIEEVWSPVEFEDDYAADVAIEPVAAEDIAIKLAQLPDSEERYQLLNQVRELTDSQKRNVADQLLYSPRVIDQVSGIDIALSISAPAFRIEQTEQLLQGTFSESATERLLDHIAADTELQQAGYVPDLLSQFVAVASDPQLKLNAMRSVLPTYENRDQLYQSLMPLLEAGVGQQLDSTLLIADRWVVDSIDTVFSNDQIAAVAVRVNEIANDTDFSADQRIQALQLSKRFH